MSGGAEVRIGAATMADLPKLLEANLAEAGGPGWPVAAWQQLLEPNGPVRSAVLLLSGTGTTELDGFLAGTLLLGISEVEYMHVRPALRRRGLGSTLLREWLRWSAEQGATTVQLEVRAKNRAALQLYDDLGFMEQGRRLGYYRSPVEDAVLMSLRLAGNPPVGSAASRG